MNRRMRSMLDGLSGQQRAIPENLQEPAKFSGFVNFRSSVSHQYDADKDKTKFTLRADGAINIHGIVLENQHTFQFGQVNNKNNIRRDHTRIIIDNPENDHRYKIGDINTKGRNFQSYFQLGGIQLSKEKIWSNSHEYRPQGNYSFTLDSDAEVEVYQDGKLTRTINLKAGEHTLSDIKANRGNKIELRIKDDFGKTYMENFTRFSDSRLLKPDYSQYALSIGVPAQRKDNNIKYDSSRTIASGYYQKGIKENVTTGLDFQTDGKSHQLGIDAIWATSFGNLSTGISHTKNTINKSGQAIRFQLDSLKTKNQMSIKKRNKTQWSLSVEQYSPDYQPLSSATVTRVDDDQQSLRRQINANISRVFSHDIDAGLDASLTDSYNGESRQYIGVGINKRIGKHAHLSLFASQTEEGDGEKDNAINISLNFPLGKSSSGRSRSFNSSYSSQNNSTRLGYNLGSKGRLSKDSLRGVVKLESKGGTQVVGGNIRFKGKKFDFNASHRPSINSSTGKVTQTSYANINTALVFADGKFAHSKPVADSFAIFSEPEGLEYPMAISRGKSLFGRESNDLYALPKHYDAVLKPKKTTVLANLSSYRLQHISADSAVLPNGFDINATEFDVMPDYKSGYKIKVGGEKGISFTATLLGKQGEPLKLEGGQLIPQGELKNSQKPILFFTNENGYLSIYGIKKGKYLMELFSDINLNEIQIQSDSQIINKNGVICFGGECNE